MPTFWNDEFEQQEDRSPQGTSPKAINQCQKIDETIAMLWEMIDGKCCHKDFIDDTVAAINALKKVRKYC